jgi:diacylglycerol O-acyltransferase / wax synthase
MAAPRAVIDRATSNDVLQLHYGTRSAENQVGALLVLDTDRPMVLPMVRDTVADRIRAIPRLRQRLETTPPGCGRPIWVDDAGFDITRHVTETRCPEPVDERSLLDLVAATITAPLPDDRSPWVMTVVHGLPNGRTGVILTFHHVLADGIGGLAVLAQLVDGAHAAPARDFPRPRPTPLQLATEATRARLRVIRGLPSTVRRVIAAIGQLRGGLASSAPRCSLNRPTGPRRTLAVVRADLDRVRDCAHRHGVTVNDVVLTAVAGALHGYLAARGEHLDHLVAVIPVSGHVNRDGGDQVHNQAGVVPVRLAAAGAPDRRLAATARATRAVKTGPRGASAALLEPLFALLAGLRIVAWYTARQRRVNTFVTNLRGPSRPLTLVGARITEVVLVGAISGNVSVAFGVLSYAGALNVTLVADPDLCTDVTELASQLQRQLDMLTRGTAAPPTARTPTGTPPGDQPSSG